MKSVVAGNDDIATKDVSVQRLWNRFKPNLVAISFYAALTLIFAWNPIINLSSGTPGNFPVDRNQNLWNLWWFQRSLLETHTNPFHTDLLFYPYGANLYLHTYSLYNMLVGLPLQSLFGRIIAFNILVLLTFPLAGYGGYLLSRYLLGNVPHREWGALLAGLVYGFSPYHFVELHFEQTDSISIQWMPFFVLFTLKLAQAETRRAIIQNGLLVALFFFLTLLTDYYYALYLVMFVGLFWLWQVGQLGWRFLQQAQLKKEQATKVGGLTLKLVGALALGTLPYSPILLNTLRDISSGKYPTLDNNLTVLTNSSDLVRLFLPTMYQPWWGSNFDLWKNLGITRLDDSGAVLGYVALILSLYALIKIRGLWFWGFSGLFWLIMSLGPNLRLNGNSSDFPLPYRILAQIPLLNIGRFPERFILMVQLSLSILAGFALVRLLGHFRERRIWLVSARPAFGLIILALFFLESWPGILPPPTPITPPAFTTVIGSRNLSSNVPANKAILELPVTKHNDQDSLRMFYQIYHQRPIVGGYLSRSLIDPYRIANDYILYNWVEFLSQTNPDIVPALSQSELLGLLNYAGIGYVVVYPADFNGNEQRLKQVQRLINETFSVNPNSSAVPFFQDALATVYRVDQAKLVKPIFVLERGWDGVETVNKTLGIYQRWIAKDAVDARAIIAIGPETPLADSYSLEIEASAPDKPRHLQVFLNDALIGDVKVETPELVKVGDVTVGKPTLIRLDNLKLRRGDNVIKLYPDPADGYFIPALAGGAQNDKRELRIAVLSIKIK